jgi:ribosome-binding factor A
MKFDRNSRISEEIKKIISSLLLTEIKDPRIPSFISITSVTTTRDHRYAYVDISIFDQNADVNEVLKALDSAKGFIRREIGKNIKLHYTPEPIFRIDNSIKNGMHINQIIKNLDIKNED